MKRIKGKIILLVIGASLFFLAGKFLLQSDTSLRAGAGQSSDILALLNAHSATLSLEEAATLGEGNVSLEATVAHYAYDEDNGTTFLTLTNGKTKLEAIVFKNTTVPSLAEGKAYTFQGSMQKAPGEQYNELVVRSVN